MAHPARAGVRPAGNFAATTYQQVLSSGIENSRLVYLTPPAVRAVLANRRVQVAAVGTDGRPPDALDKGDEGIRERRLAALQVRSAFQARELQPRVRMEQQLSVDDFDADKGAVFAFERVLVRYPFCESLRVCPGAASRSRSRSIQVVVHDEAGLWVGNFARELGPSVDKTVIAIHVTSWELKRHAPQMLVVVAFAPVVHSDAYMAVVKGRRVLLEPDEELLAGLQVRFLFWR